MSRLLVILVVVVVLLIGGLVLLAGRDGTTPPARIEKAVALDNLN